MTSAPSRSLAAILATLLGLGLGSRALAQDTPKPGETPAAPAPAIPTPAAPASGTAAVDSTASPGHFAPAGPAPNGFQPKIAAKVFPSIVKVYGAGGFKGIPSFGTGVVVDESGIIATAWSVALTTDRLRVVTDQGQMLLAKILKQDTKHGLALLKVEAGAKLPAVSLVETLPQAGDFVYSVGNAFDDAAGDEKCAVVGGVVTAVAALDMRVGIEDGPALGEVILTDAPNNPGTQGGALVSREGKLVGVLGRLVESKSTNTQINFAVPATVLRTLLAVALGGPEPTSEAAKPHPAGVETGIRFLDAHLTRSPPAYVERIVPGGPGERAGLQPDDLVFRLDGRVVRSCRAFEDLLRDHGPGEKVKLEVKRGAKVVELTLELAARKDN